VGFFFIFMETTNYYPFDLMAKLDAHEAALARALGVEIAPYIPPTEKFYLSNYIMDGCVAADFRTDFGYFASSQKQLNSFKRTQRGDGMVLGVSHPAHIKSSFNPERLLSTAPLVGNDYTQTPVWANSVLKLYDAAYNGPAATSEQSINPDVFLRQIYPALRRYYLYFVEQRQVASGDPRVFLLHPNEANRDSAPEYDPWKQAELERQLGELAILAPRHMPRTGEYMPWWFNQINRANDYLGTIAINLAGFKKGWEPARIHEDTEFIDVWFNCLLYENYHAMSEIATRLGDDEDADMFHDLALRLSHAIKDKHYFPDARDGDGAFYPIYNDKPVFKDTIGNLVTYLIKDLEERHLKSNHTLVRKAFNTPYMLPSVATDDIADFDPHYQEVHRHWHAPVWPVANNILKRGQKIHLARGEEISEYLHDGSRRLIRDIDRSNFGLLELNRDSAEHNDPITGRGQRLHKTKGHVFGIGSLPG
jgi:hypothetical protein